MRRISVANAISILVLAAVVVLAPGLAKSAAVIGKASKVVNKVYGATISKSIRLGDNLIENQKVRTGRASAANIIFTDKSNLALGELSTVVLDRLIFDPRQKKLTGALQLVKGIMRFASARTVTLDIRIKTRHAILGVRGTAFDVSATSSETEIAVHEGVVRVQSPQGMADVEAGQVYRVSANRAPVKLPGPSETMRRGVAKMSSMLELKTPGSERQTAGLPETALAAFEETPAFKKAIENKNPSNLLYLDTSVGRLVIELKPKLAPRHVSRIKELVRKKFYDGQVFHSVVPGFAVETGDPTGSGRGGSGKMLEAEISSARFVPGTVGMKRDRNNIDTADSQFFIVLRKAAHLDGKYTIWGKVIFGLDRLKYMRKGNPPTHPDRIISFSLATDSKK